MAFKRVAPETKLAALKPLPGRDNIVLEVGGYVEGYFLGVQEHPKVRSGFVSLQTEDGKVINLLNYSGIDWQIKRVPVGTMVRIEYRGKRKGTNGREFHDFVVYMDEERKLEGGVAADMLEKIAEEAGRVVEEVKDYEEDIEF